MSLASALVAAGAMLASEPDAPLAVGLVVAAIAVSSGAAAAALLLSLPAADRRRRQRVAPALRRGIEITAVVALLLLLRVVDGLTVITGGFIVLGFLVAEAILAARPRRASR
ncbi:MAG TPA: hypothetical protein VMQ78_03795 [Candidatus Limnocylindria bacterium]|nr:hypothetical protein [Candidatus Limnocylindria bacterium]